MRLGLSAAEGLDGCICPVILKSVAKVANGMLNVIVSKLVSHDWNQISSGSRHRTFVGSLLLSNF